MMDTPALQAGFDLPFAEQIEFFRGKLHLPSQRWDDIRQSAHDRAFIVAGAQKADLLADLHASIGQHMAGGAGLEGFRRDFKAIVARHGWSGWSGEGTAAGVAWRTRVIYETNLNTSYAAGRWRQLNESGVRWWMYQHSGLAQEPRAQHLAWSGLVLPAEHPFWRTHFPPNGWGCGCRVVGVASPALARRLGGDPSKTLPAGWDSPQPSNGTPPGIDPGFAYAPGANAKTPLSEMLQRKLITLPAPIGAAMWDSLKGAVAMERQLAWYDTLDAWRSSGQVGAPRTHVVGALDALTLAWLQVEKKIAPVSAEIAIQDRLILGPKEHRHQGRLRDGLSAAEWRRLPELLEHPAQVLYDTRSGHLLYVGDGALATEKLTVEFDFRVDKKLDKRANLIVSAYRQRLADILGSIKGGVWEVVK